MKKKDLCFKTFRGGIVVILSIVLMLFLVSCSSESGDIKDGSKGTSVKDSKKDSKDDSKKKSKENSDGVLVFEDLVGCWNTDGEIYEIDNVYYGRSSGDQTIVTYTGGDEDGNTALYYITSNFEPKLVATNVWNYDISYSGEYIAYTQDNEDMETESFTYRDLFIYSVKDDKATQIDTEVEYFVLSPSGETVVYQKENGSYDNLFVGGYNIEKTLIGGNEETYYSPVAVSNDGKMIYYLERMEFYVYRDNEHKLLSPDLTYKAWFNNDASEILYSDNESSYYFTSEMEEPQNIPDNIVAHIYTPYDLICHEMGFALGNYRGFILGKDKLVDSLFYGGSSLHWFNGEGDVIPVAESTYNTYLSEDGKTLIYNNHSTLYKVDINNEMKVSTICEDIYDSVVSKDLSNIYIMDSFDLYYYNGENDLVQITQNLDSNLRADNLTFNEGMQKLFFVQEGVLYSVGTSAESKEEIARDVWKVRSFKNGVIYSVGNEDEYTEYYISDGEPFEILHPSPDA